MIKKIKTLYTKIALNIPIKKSMFNVIGLAGLITKFLECSETNLTVIRGEMVTNGLEALIHEPLLLQEIYMD